MSRKVTVDLDQATAEDLDRLWHEVARRRAPRQASPGVYDALVAALPKLPAELATAVRADLDAGTHPLAVVVAHFGDKPAVGAFPKPDLPAPDPVALFGATRLLEESVRQMTLFTKDRRRVVEAGIELADQLGVPEAEADRIIAGVVQGGRNVG